MNKQDKFIGWLLGYGRFPFFQDMPEIPDIEMPLDKHDCHVSSEDGCAGCDKAV